MTLVNGSVSTRFNRFLAPVEAANIQWPKHFFWSKEAMDQLPLTMFYISSKINIFRKSNIQYRFFMKVGNWTWSRTMQVVINFKCVHASNMRQNKIRFFKTFPSPSQTHPFVFLGLRPRFEPRPQFSYASHLRLGFRPRFSGASCPWSGLALPSTFDWSTCSSI